MEVIRHDLFTLDHRGSKSWALRLPCLRCNSLCGSLEMTEVSLRYTEFTVGSPVKQEPKQRGPIGESEKSCRDRVAIRFCKVFVKTLQFCRLLSAVKN